MSMWICMIIFQAQTNGRPPLEFSAEVKKLIAKQGGVSTSDEGRLLIYIQQVSLHGKIRSTGL